MNNLAERKNEVIEEWKPIIDYENLYMISNLGRVKKLENQVTQKDLKGNIYTRTFPEKILKERNNKTDYITVGLNTNNISKTFRIHRLVAIHFIPNPENKPEVNHINGIKSDNRLENLEWCTSAENSKHALETELTKIQYGSETTNSKLTEKEVLEIRKLKETTNMTSTEIGKLFGVNQPAISKIIHRKTWKHI